MAGNCQRVTIVKLKKLPSAYARSVRRRARLAAREDSGKLSGCFYIRRQNGSEGVAEGGVRFLPMGRPRMTQPWLGCILISRQAGAIGRVIISPRRVDARGQKKAPDGVTRVAFSGLSPKGAGASSGCFHAETKYAERGSFIGAFLVSQYGARRWEKKRCSRQLFLGPPLGPLADRSILCSYHVMFPPVCVPAFLQQLHQDARSALCRARVYGGHPMLGIRPIFSDKVCLYL